MCPKSNPWRPYLSGIPVGGEGAISMKSLRLCASFLLIFLFLIGSEFICSSQAYSAYSFTTQSAVVSVDSIEALRNVKPNTTVIVTGYYALGDGGGGLYLWSADSEAPGNGGTIIAPNGHSTPGRWMRTPEHQSVFVGSVRVATV